MFEMKIPIHDLVTFYAYRKERVEREKTWLRRYKGLNLNMIGFLRAFLKKSSKISLIYSLMLILFVKLVVNITFTVYKYILYFQTSISTY